MTELNVSLDRNILVHLLSAKAISFVFVCCFTCTPDRSLGHTAQILVLRFAWSVEKHFHVLKTPQFPSERSSSLPGISVC